VKRGGRGGLASGASAGDGSGGDRRRCALGRSAAVELRRGASAFRRASVTAPPQSCREKDERSQSHAVLERSSDEGGPAGLGHARPAEADKGGDSAGRGASSRDASPVREEGPALYKVPGFPPEFLPLPKSPRLDRRIRRTAATCRRDGLAAELALRVRTAADPSWGFLADRHPLYMYFAWRAVRWRDGDGMRRGWTGEGDPCHVDPPRPSPRPSCRCKESGAEDPPPSDDDDGGDDGAKFVGESGLLVPGHYGGGDSGSDPDDVDDDAGDGDGDGGGGPDAAASALAASLLRAAGGDTAAALREACIRLVAAGTAGGKAEVEAGNLALAAPGRAPEAPPRSRLVVSRPEPAAPQPPPPPPPQLAEEEPGKGAGPGPASGPAAAAVDADAATDGLNAVADANAVAAERRRVMDDRLARARALVASSLRATETEATEATTASAGAGDAKRRRHSPRSSPRPAPVPPPPPPPPVLPPKLPPRPGAADRARLAAAHRAVLAVNSDDDLA